MATVILVHGRWTPAAVFSLHGHWLRRRGYRALRDLPRPNDGVVALEETQPPGAADFVALPLAHSGLLASRPCAQIAAFLENGRLLHAWPEQGTEAASRCGE